MRQKPDSAEVRTLPGAPRWGIQPLAPGINTCGLVLASQDSRAPRRKGKSVGTPARLGEVTVLARARLVTQVSRTKVEWSCAVYTICLLQKTKKTFRCRSCELEECRALGGSAPATATRGSGSAHLEVPHPKPGNDWLAPGSRPATRLLEHVVETWICQRTCLDCKASRLRVASAQAPSFAPLGQEFPLHFMCLSVAALFRLQLPRSRTHLLGMLFQPPTGEPEGQNARRTSARSTKAEADAGKLAAATLLELRLRKESLMQAERINGRAETDARGSHCKRGT